MPVQYVIRTGARWVACSAGDLRRGERHTYRGYAGRVASGTVRPGDEVVVLPAGLATRVASVETADGALDAASAGRSVTVLLADDLDVSRGDLLAAAGAPPTLTNRLEATLCWLADKPVGPGARLLLKHGTRTTPVIVGAMTELLDTDTLTFGEPPAQLTINDIARVGLRTADPLPVDEYAAIRATGSFLLIDPPTGDTLAAGLLGDQLDSALPSEHGELAHGSTDVLDLEERTWRPAGRHGLS
jgi:sulfate adenylyltransferase subunit 1